MRPLRIIVGFDGAAPFSEEGVTARADGSFEVRPSWRSAPGESEELPGCGGRFWVRVVNESTGPARFDCFVNWEDTSEAHRKLRDWVAVLLPGADEWSTVAAPIEANGVRVVLDLPPGETQLAASPEYSYGVALDYFRRKQAAPGTVLSSIGRSEEGREIPVLRIDDPTGQPRKADFMYFGRNHAYETAGSYCAEGMIDFLLSDDSRARESRRRYRFHFLPMTNPDGVHNGLSRLTAPKGADVNRIRPQADATWRALRDYVDAVKPQLHLNIHNWLSKTHDGLLANTREFAERFQALMPDQRCDGKVWMVEWTERFLEREGIRDYSPGSDAWLRHASWKNDVAARFGGIGLTLEFPWFGRTTARMRDLGRDALIAFLAAAGERTK